MSASSAAMGLKTIAMRVAGPPVRRSIETIKASLPRKIGMHGQPRVFHSPSTALWRRPPHLRRRADGGGV